MNYTEQVQHHGSVRAASRALGIPRSTLRDKLKKERTEAKKVPQTLPQKAKDALKSVCDEMGINFDEVQGGWLKSETASIRVARSADAQKFHITSDLTAILDSARRVIVRPAECRTADSMAVISLHDAHFGKLSWCKDAGENYDPDITAAIYRQAVSDALTHFNPSRIKKIVIPIGSDMLHVDNLKSETTAGTRVDSVDTRIHKVFDIATAAVIAAVEDCVQVADVAVIVIPGNHDETLSILIAKVVKQYFRNDPRVVVDDSEVSRKYLHWGTNLICFTHRLSKPAMAPNVMATERPHEWANSTTKEFHTGHYHQRKATEYHPYQEYQGVLVRILPSISASDKWHFDNQFVSNVRAGETFLYSEDQGFIASHLAKVRM